jgi:ribonuclease III
MKLNNINEKNEVNKKTDKDINSSFFTAKQKSVIKKLIENIKETENFHHAFVHTSYLNENNLKTSMSYETLEFLGDSVLNFYTSLFIYNSFSHYSEGQMSKLKQLMVQESTLAYLSKEIELGKYLQLGEGEKKNQGNTKISILADIFESFVAALYLEKGGKIVWRFLTLTLFFWVKGKESLTWDHKSQLQEYCQAQKIKLSYYLKAEKRLGHKQLFFIEAILEDRDLSKFPSVICRQIGKGNSKKEAEQEAAAKVIEKLGIEEKI